MASKPYVDHVDRDPRDSVLWDPIADLLDDVSGSVRSVPSDGLGVARRSMAPQPTTPQQSSGRESARASTYIRRSSEWETETLLNHGSGDLEGEMPSYPCPFRQRNPARFNIRDHEACARGPFDSILGLR